tara:strand:+ start:10222 stop:10701 length:480 start_codon:yes stop_codon:yes gene_type:complete
MSIKSSEIKYINNIISKSYCNYVSDKMKKVQELEYKKNMNDTMVYANVRYQKTRIIRSMYLVVNKYIKQLNINIESNDLSIRKYLYVTYLKSNELIETLNLMINDDLYNQYQKKYFTLLIITLKKNKELIDKRMEYMMSLLLENTELPVDMIREIMKFI